MPRLGVNIDHIASIRQLRSGIEPDPVFAAKIAEAAGADSIVVHLREDRRHINEKDLCLLKKTVRVKLNLEMSIAGEIVGIASEVKPDQATLVPEKRKEITTEGGLDVKGNFKNIREAVSKLKDKGIAVSLFIDPRKEQIDYAKRAGAGIIELHTGEYANTKNKKQQSAALKDIVSCVNYGVKAGMIVSAGHGLNYFNVANIASIKGIDELNIGYSIICRGSLIGLGAAVRQMKELIS